MEWSFDREKFWKAVRAKKMNLLKIARESGLSVGTVMNAAKGFSVSMYVFAKICYVLGCELEYLRETYHGIFERR